MIVGGLGYAFRRFWLKEPPFIEPPKKEEEVKAP
jgi:hypothetical protein